MFLVALNVKGPLFYTLVEREDGAEVSRLVYTGESEAAIITKTFIVHKKVCQVDLILDVSPLRSDVPLCARVFCQAPTRPEQYACDAQRFS